MKIFIAMILVVALVTPAYSDTAWIANATIKRTLVRDKAYGNCMVQLDKAIADTGLDCAADWVTFSCDGTYNARDVASKMLDSAMMAFALGRQVSVQLDDNKKHHGYCVVKRIDVMSK